MFLKNYTSDVAPSTTIQRIVALLVKIGVAQISMDYAQDGSIIGITFHAPLGGGQPVPIRLPVDVAGAQQALWLDYAGSDKLDPSGERLVWARNKRKVKKDFLDQAQRTAWRLMQDWLEVQISMVQLKQADVLQVFLPYAWDGKQSYYHRLKSGGFAALMPPKQSPTHAEVIET